MELTVLGLLVGVLLLVGAVTLQLRGVQAQIEAGRRLAQQQLEQGQTVSREVAASAEQIEHIRELVVALDRDLRRDETES